MLSVSFAVAVGAAVGVAADGPDQLLGMLIGLPLVHLVAGVASALAALAVRIDVHTLDVGFGRPLRTVERGRCAATVHAIPLGLSWTGYAQGPRAVRTRFAVTQAAAALGWAGAATYALVDLGLVGLFTTAMLLLIAGSLPRPGWGVPDAPRRLLALARTSDAELLDWWNTRLGGMARDAALAGRLEEARELAEQALDADPQDRAAWRALNIVGNDRPDTALALRSAEQLAGQTQGLSYATAQGTDQGNLAWALVRTAEAGHPPADWAPRARVALYEADAVDEPTWQRLHTYALLSVLTGETALAEDSLERPRQEAIVPSERVSVLLTEALVRHRQGNPAAAAALHAEAVATWPASPRINDVARLLASSRGA